jgi:hypothetical protein
MTEMAALAVVEFVGATPARKERPWRARWK